MGVKVASVGNSPITFNVARPGNLPVVLPIFDEIVVVTDVYGLPIQGAKVTLSAGQQVQQELTNGSGIALFPQLPSGQVEGTIQYLTFSQNFHSSDNTSHTIYATASLSYPILTTILVIAALASYATLRSIRKKPREYNYFFS